MKYLGTLQRKENLSRYYNFFRKKCKVNTRPGFQYVREVVRTSKLENMSLLQPSIYIYCQAVNKMMHSDIKLSCFIKTDYIKLPCFIQCYYCIKCVPVFHFHILRNNTSLFTAC